MPKPSIPVRCLHLADPVYYRAREYEVTLWNTMAANSCMQIYHLCEECSREVVHLLSTHGAHAQNTPGVNSVGGVRAGGR